MSRGNPTWPRKTASSHEVAARGGPTPRKSGSRPRFILFRTSSDFDIDVIAFDRHGETGDPHFRIVNAGAGSEVILPAMQWANHASAVNVAGAERSAKMTARVVDRIVDAARIEQRNLATARLNDDRTAVGNFAPSRNFD